MPPKRIDPIINRRPNNPRPPRLQQRLHLHHLLLRRQQAHNFQRARPNNLTPLHPPIHRRHQQKPVLNLILPLKTHYLEIKN